MAAPPCKQRKPHWLAVECDSGPDHCGQWVVWIAAPPCTSTGGVMAHAVGRQSGRLAVQRESRKQRRGQPYRATLCNPSTLPPFSSQCKWLPSAGPGLGLGQTRFLRRWQPRRAGRVPSPTGRAPQTAGRGSCVVLGRIGTRNRSAAIKQASARHHRPSATKSRAVAAWEEHTRSVCWLVI